MMNKGLELIEACHLFDLAESQINVVIHPQSIIHSLVEYCDGSFLAQMGSPDMRTPIAHALAYPNRISAGVESLDLYQLSSLEFIKPDLKKFACLKLAREAMQSGQAASITLNAANEVAVEAFIKQQVSLTDIALINAQVLDKMLGKDKSVAGHADISVRQITELNDILMIDKIAREQAQLEVMACRN
jgi:1-deoxy-D-xylulose-5-phosphate reductoisomerase